MSSHVIPASPGIREFQFPPMDHPTRIAFSSDDPSGQSLIVDVFCFYNRSVMETGGLASSLRGFAVPANTPVRIVIRNTSATERTVAVDLVPDELKGQPFVARDGAVFRLERRQDDHGAYFEVQSEGGRKLGTIRFIGDRTDCQFDLFGNESYFVEIVTDLKNRGF